MMEQLIDYPFVRTEKEFFDGKDLQKVKCWRPGIDWEVDDYGDGSPWAEKLGKMVLTEIDSHKLPKPYPERVFYLREWIDPDGRRFGKRNLRIITRSGYTCMLKGYRHEFELEYPVT